METGKIVIEKVRGKSTVTKSFSKYPLKFIVPRKVAQSCFFLGLVHALFISFFYRPKLKRLNRLSLQVGPSWVDAVWIYALTYGGGIVSVRFHFPNFIIFLNWQFKNLKSLLEMCEGMLVSVRFETVVSGRVVFGVFSMGPCGGLMMNIRWRGNGSELRV